MATINQIAPVTGSTNVVLDLSLTNNDPGAIYNSGTLNTFDSLDDALWALPANQAGYATKADMLGDWDIDVRSPPTGEVHNGWSAQLNTDGTVILNHISGIADLSYTVWDTDANSDMMALTVSIPKAQLEVDGITGYDPQNDATIILHTTRNDAFVAEEGGTFGREWQAPGQSYDISVVPEPASAILMAAGLVLVAARRRVRQLVHPKPSHRA